MENRDSIKEKYYGRLFEFYLQMPSGSIITKGKVSTSCYNFTDDLPMPFGCRHLEVSITPKQLELGEEGIFICSKTGCKCELCENNDVTYCNLSK